MNNITDLDLEVEGGVVINPNSAYAREMRKWEMFPSQYGKNPGNPWDQVRANGAFPKMLYKAHKLQNGKYSAGEIYPTALDCANMAELERAHLLIDRFNRECQKKVDDQAQMERAYSDGWRATAPEALEAAEAYERDIAKAAGEAAFQASRMTEKAQREFAAANADTEHHVVDVVPMKDGGKATTAAVTSGGRQK